MENTISLCEVNLKNSANLADMISNDDVLIKALKTKKTLVSPQEFFDTTNEWQLKNNANSYAIILDQECIGMISLSHQHTKTARIGVWIASKHWDKGYATQSLNLLLELAKQQGFTTINATIEHDVVASLRIWKKLGAEIIDDGKKYQIELKIG